MKPAMAEAFTSEEKPTGGRGADGRRPSLMDPEPPMAATTETTTNGTTESKATEKLRSATAFEAIVVFAVLAAHVAGFVAAYTALGRGEEVFRELNDYYNTAVAIGSAAFLIIFLIYIFDGFMGIGDGTFFGKVKVVIAMCLGLAIAVGAVLSVERYPTAPAVIVALMMLGATYGLRRYFVPDISMGSFLNAVGYSLNVSGVGTFIAWIVWVVDGNEWDDKLRLKLEKELQCEELETGAETEQCLAAYLMWAWPGACASMLMLFGFTCIYLGQALNRFNAAAAAKGLAKFMMYMCMLGVLTLWIAASIAGVEMGLANVVLQFSVIVIGLLVFLGYSALGSDAMSGVTNSVALFRKFEEYSESDVLKSFIMIVFLPPIVCYCILSGVNQLMRKCIKASCMGPVDEEEEAHRNGTSMTADSPKMAHTGSLRDPSPLSGQLTFLTVRAKRQIERMLLRPTSVIVKAHWWAVLYFSLQVGAGKFVIIFLSWFSDVIGPLHEGLIVVIFVIIGIIMFLLPPVPGPPVYLFAGIVLVRKMKDGPIGFWGAIVVAIFASFFVKLGACGLQQKMIGENLADSLYVRKTLGINSVTMRAIRYNLEQKGFTPGKVAILCGGPDWPTSVTCGILRLSLFQCMLGTSPVLVLYIAESVLAAGFQLRREEGGLWASLADVSIGVTAVFMGITMFTAVYYIEETIDKKRDYLMDPKTYPYDEEVLAIEEQDKRQGEVYEMATRWENVPQWLRYTLSFGLFCMSMSSYAFCVYGETCFRDFQVHDKLNKLPDSNPINIIRFYGAVAIVIFLVGCACLHAFRRWAQKAVAEYQSGSAPTTVDSNKVAPM